MPFSIEQHMCCDFCTKVNTDCVRLQGLHTAQRSCLSCLRAAVQLLEAGKETPIAETSDIDRQVDLYWQQETRGEPTA